MTHIQPLGCFGSTLAFAPETSVCASCTERTECESLVDNRRPLVMRLLGKYNDAQGKPMSLPWMTKVERKAFRDRQRAEETFDDAEIVMELKVGLDKRAHSTIDRFVKMRVNPMVASLEVVGGVSRVMLAVITALRQRPHTMRELVAVVAARSTDSASSAQRDTYATVSILTACQRVTRNGSTLELA